MNSFALVSVRCPGCGSIIGSKQKAFEEAKDALAKDLQSKRERILGLAAAGLISNEEKEELASQLQEGVKEARAKIMEDLGVKRYCCIKELINAPEYSFDYVPEDEVLRGLRELNVADPALINYPAHVTPPFAAPDVKSVVPATGASAASGVSGFVLPVATETCKTVDVGGGFKVPQRPCRVYQLSDVKYGAKKATTKAVAKK